MKKIDRWEFLQLAGGILGAGVATAAAACGGDDTTAPGASASCNASSPSATIASNHGHMMTVTGADVTAGATKMYNIQGSAPHSHSVTISDVKFRDLMGGKSIQAESTPGGTDGH